LEYVALFYGHLEYFRDIWDIFMTIWTILCSFGAFFGIMSQEKSGNPAPKWHRRGMPPFSLPLF
jgi:hypothetical protein